MEENKENIIDDTESEAVQEVPAENESESELDEAKKAADELREKFLRVSAEYENFRKRTIKEKESLYSDGKSACAAQFLPLADNMDRAMVAAQEEGGADGILKGMEMIAKQLADILAALSIEEIPAVGEEFNPELHNAVMHIEDEKIDTNTIVEEFQKGYTMDGKVIRHSMVKVAN